MKKTLLLILGLALVAGFAFANGDDEAAPAVLTADPVEEAAEAYFATIEGSNIIKEDVFIEKVKAGEDMVVIDIRQPDVYAESHVTGAINIPWGAAIADELDKFPTSGNVYVYCYTGQTAGQTVAFLNVAGIPAQSVRYGFVRGITTVAGHEAILDAKPVEATMSYDVDPAFQAAADAYFKNLGDAPFKNNIVAAADAAAIKDAGEDVQFVDVRQAEDYAAGHIEGAMNIPWGNGMQTSFADLPADKKLIVNCYSGQTAGQTVAILRLLGYDAVSLRNGMGTPKTGDGGWANEGFELVK
jgi:rhodanese-related sulfurtransferase